MAIDTSGPFWVGDDGEDLAEYLRQFSAAGYPATRVVAATCPCGSAEFGVVLDDEEGVAVRTCTACGLEHAVLDSGDHLDDADLGDAACPCGGETFEVAAGFALLDDGEVRWVYVGLRCTADGVLGCYADWKIDYAPSTHLLELV